MAFNTNPRETRVTEYRSWQVQVGGYGDQALNEKLLSLTSESREIYSIDLVEIRYQLTAGEVGDNRLVRLAWQDDSKTNNIGRHFITLAPIRLADGSYTGEYKRAMA